MFNNKLEVVKNQLQKAQEKLIAAESNYNHLQSELEFRMEIALSDAQSEIDKAQEDVEKAKKEYELLLTQLAIDNIRKPNNAFEKKFYLATHFCQKDIDHQRHLNFVKIDESELAACDGDAIIKIRCNNIPTRLKNKLVAWDSLNFDNLDNLLDNNKYLDLDYIINQNKQQLSNSKKCTKDDIIRTISSSKKIQETDRTIIVINLNETIIALNYKYVKYGTEALSNTEPITVRWKNEKNPLIFETDHVTVLIMPIYSPSITHRLESNGS